MRQFSEDFIADCRNGDSKKQKELFEELYAPMYRVCLRYAGQQADAEDCLMKGFMKVFQNLSKFRYEGECSLFVWTRRIMVNESLMFIRQKHNFMISIEEQVTDVSIEADAIASMHAEELHSLVLSLPTGYRTVFNLNVVEGYDHKEIAGMLGITESTSRTQLAKAKNKLRLMLSENFISTKERVGTNRKLQ